jgi:hypothetical protein
VVGEHAHVGARLRGGAGRGGAAVPPLGGCVRAPRGPAAAAARRCGTRAGTAAGVEGAATALGGRRDGAVALAIRVPGAGGGGEQVQCRGVPWSVVAKLQADSVVAFRRWCGQT